MLEEGGFGCTPIPVDSFGPAEVWGEAPVFARRAAPTPVIKS